MNKKQLEEYYYNNMVYDRAFESEKKAILKNHTKVELEYIFKVLYSVNKVYGDKQYIFEEIQRYFDNIERAKKIYRGNF